MGHSRFCQGVVAWSDRKGTVLSIVGVTGSGSGPLRFSLVLGCVWVLFLVLSEERKSRRFRLQRIPVSAAAVYDFP